MTEPERPALGVQGASAELPLLGCPQLCIASPSSAKVLITPRWGSIGDSTIVIQMSLKLVPWVQAALAVVVGENLCSSVALSGFAVAAAAIVMALRSAPPLSSSSVGIAFTSARWWPHFEKAQIALQAELDNMDQTNPGSDATKEVRFTLDELNLIFYGGSMGGAWGHWTVVARAADGQPELGPAADADQMTLMRQTLLAFGAETRPPTASRHCLEEAQQSLRASELGMAAEQQLAGPTMFEGPSPGSDAPAASARELALAMVVMRCSSVLARPRRRLAGSASMPRAGGSRAAEPALAAEGDVADWDPTSPSLHRYSASRPGGRRKVTDVGATGSSEGVGAAAESLDAQGLQGAGEGKSKAEVAAEASALMAPSGT